MQHLGSEGPTPADDDGLSSKAADSGKSSNRQNFELGISRDYTVRSRLSRIKASGADCGVAVRWQLSTVVCISATCDHLRKIFLTLCCAQVWEMALCGC